MKLTSLEKTCWACPAQWEGQLDDGRYIYIRYRWGYLQVGYGKTIDEAIDNRNYGTKIGDDFDGYLETPEMIKILNIELINT